MTMRMQSTVAGLALVLVLASCSNGGQRDANVPEPWCDDWGILMLEAQSVPSAQLIPCIEALPLGWSSAPARIDHEGTWFVLNSSIAGEEAVTVELTERCDITGAIRVPSEINDAARYEWVEEIVSGFSGRRTYMFDGGCTVFTFDFGVDAVAALVNEVSLAVGFVPREVINEAVRTATEGREQLDPQPTG
jgi:hypothetical protein